MGLAVASTATRKDKIKEASSNVTIFMRNSTVNSRLGIHVLGIGGACTFNGVRRVLIPSGTEVAPSYRGFVGYNNYA